MTGQYWSLLPGNEKLFLHNVSTLAIYRLSYLECFKKLILAVNSNLIIIFIPVKYGYLLTVSIHFQLKQPQCTSIHIMHKTTSNKHKSSCVAVKNHSREDLQACSFISTKSPKNFQLILLAFAGEPKYRNPADNRGLKALPYLFCWWSHRMINLH